MVKLHAEKRPTNPTNFRLSLASLMPPISHPPRTWRRRFAATSALFLFLLLPTPLPSAAAQPASTPPSDESFSSAPAWGIFSLPVAEVVLLVTFSSLFFLFILHSAILVYLYYILPNLPPYAAAQLASPPPGVEISSLTPAYSSLDRPIALGLASVLFLLLFYLCLLLFYICLSPLIHPPLLVDPEDSIGRAVRSRRRLGARSVDPAVIETFPTVVYSAVKGHKIGEASLECAVCLNDFEDDDTLRLIPKCDHAFHPDCIGAWLASHTTCPVCRADLASQRAGDPATQLAESGTEPPWVEGAPPDGGAPGRSPRGGGRERIQPLDQRDKSESGSFNDGNRTLGSGRIRRFPRSHSTGHSLVRPGEDIERFTLRLPAEVRKQLMDRPRPVLPQEGCSRQGYRCGGEGSSPARYCRRPDRLDRAAKSERWTLNTILPRVAADGGGGSSQGSVQQARPAI